MERSQGYLRLSALFAQRPELATFPCFAHLNAWVLCQQAAEIVDLEAQLLHSVKLDRDDEDAGLAELEVNFAAECQTRSDTYEKLLQLRNMLKAYNKAILSFKQVYELPRIQNATFESLRYWFRMPTGGDNFPRRYQSRVWKPDTGFDLLTPLYPKKDQDILSRFTYERLIPWLNDKFLGRWWADTKVFDPLTQKLQPEPLHHYRDTALATAINTLSIITAYSLIIGPVFGLFYAESRLAKIVIIAISALTFCLAICLLTKAKRAEHFLALAAFAAVLVVFVSNDERFTSRDH